MNTPEQPTQAEAAGGTVNARRKLIRGAFALPVLAAVHSGSASASSSLRCLGNGPAGTQAPAVIRFGQPDPISYLRIPLAVTRRVNPDNNSGDFQYLYYVSFRDVSDAATARRVGIRSGLISSGSFKRFDPVNNEITDPGTNQPLADIQREGYTLVTDRTQLDNANRLFAALIFNPEGTEIIGVGRVSMRGHAATESCWTSFGIPPL